MPGCLSAVLEGASSDHKEHTTHVQLVVTNLKELVLRTAKHAGGAVRIPACLALYRLMEALKVYDSKRLLQNCYTATQRYLKHISW